MVRRDRRSGDIPEALRRGRGLGKEREAELGAVLRDPAASAAAKRAARDELAVGNTALVLFAADRYVGRGLDLEDLVGAGNRGLLRAAAGYDPARGRFSTYAVTWIRQALQRAVDDEVSLVAVPAPRNAQLARWRKARHALDIRLGRPPTAAEVDAELGLPASVARILARARAARRPGRLPGVDRRAATIGPPEAAELAELRAAVSRAYGSLPGRWRQVIGMRFGLDGPVMSRNEIGAALGVSREVVRRLENRAAALLRRKLARFDAGELAESA